jgi:hypothetical protein
VICSNWKEALDMIEEPAILSINDKLRISEKLDCHWNNIIKVVNLKQRKRKTHLIYFWKSIIKFDRIVHKLRIPKIKL